MDIVCIATPDHWHPYMMVEACKAGKDVYVEKPICVTVEEGKKMVEAARKYKRVVQAGTQQRSGEHFKKAVELVKIGEIGKVTFCPHLELSESCRWKASAIRRTASRPPISIGICGLDPRRNARSMRIDSVSILKSFRISAGSGTMLAE